jgi:hypothetical protein
MRLVLSLLALSILGNSALAAEHGLRFTAAENLLPPMKGISVVKAGEPGPGGPKYKAIAETSKYKETVKLPGDGPYDIWWQPKEGIAVRVIAGVKLKDGEEKEIKIDNYVGIVNVRGDGQPRAGLVTIAAQDAPGPDEKGHVAIQTAKDFRVDMVVPPGFYSLWITPDNGARPRKINDRFRVLAGKSVTLD